jgi:tetratricopeptide (TPR) repeat protein
MSVSKTGFGASVGGRGGRYSVHTSGRRTTSVGVPGSGVSFVSTKGGGGGRSAAGSGSRSGQPAPATVAAMLPKPGMFAGKEEKAYYQGIQAHFSGDQARALEAFEACRMAAPDAPSAALFAAVCANNLGQKEREIFYFEQVVQSPQVMPDRLQSKYLPSWASLTLQIKLTDMISAVAPFDSTGACLALAERYQEADRLEEAIGLVQQLYEANPTDPEIALSLADLLLADKDYEGVLEVAKGAANDSDLGAAMLHMRGAALFALGMETGAIDAFRDALAKPSRDKELLKAVRYDRGVAYEAVGQPGRARQDFEKVYAVDPAYMDVKDRLATKSEG